MTKQTKKLIINISVIVALTAITVTVLLLSYRELNFKNIWNFLVKSKAWCIALAFVCMLLFIVFEGVALFVIARRLGHKAKMKGALAYSSADVYYSAITPSASGGQPASMFYMVRDGMSGGVAGFSLVFNLMAYTAAIIVMGIFAFIVRPGIFGALGSGFAQTLVILGFVLQALLLAFFVVCIMWVKAILKMGNGIITLLNKIRIIKKPDKWRNKWKSSVEKYSACRDIIKSHPGLFIEALFYNLLQRVSQTLIPCFVCYAASDSASFLDLFVMQTMVLLGYNMIPLPGGVGAYEYMYLNTFCIAYEESFILSAMMVSRVISYYACMIVSGVYTLVYHSVGMRGKTPPDENETLAAEWQRHMYTEGEIMCGEDSSQSVEVQTYSEGENPDGDFAAADDPDAAPDSEGGAFVPDTPLPEEHEDEEGQSVTDTAEQDNEPDDGGKHGE